MKSYTYLIRHRPSGKVYYGFRSANKVEPHNDLWKHYFTSSPGVQKLIKETGADSFDTEIRQVFETKEQAVAWETRVLTRCKVLHDNRWLNQNVAGYIVPTEESRKKISDFHKDKNKSEEHKQKIRQGNLGKNKGKIATDEHRRKNSESHKGKKNAMYGKSHSEETKAKFVGRKPNKHWLGKKFSDEQKAHLSMERTCPHCGKIGKGNAMIRHHMDNCKFAEELA
jgi:hypothetical protein